MVAPLLISLVFQLTGPQTGIQTGEERIISRALAAAGIDVVQASLRAGAVYVTPSNSEWITVSYYRKVSGGAPEERRRVKELVDLKSSATEEQSGSPKPARSDDRLTAPSDSKWRSESECPLASA